MGPRLISRGVFALTRYAQLVPTSLQWGRGSLAAACATIVSATLVLACFNGAAACAASAAMPWGLRSLQWGRGSLAAAWNVARKGCAWLLASMGPRLISRGVVIAVPGYIPGEVLQWGRGVRAIAMPSRSATYASMGPRLISRGVVSVRSS